MPIYIQYCGFHSALGSSVAEIHDCLTNEHRSNMVEVDDMLNDGKSTVVGKVAGDLPEIPQHLAEYATRNNQLALSALNQIKDSIEQAKLQFGSDKVAVVIGTSTSGISDGEAAFKHKLTHDEFPEHYHYSKQELGNTSEFVSQYMRDNGAKLCNLDGLLIKWPCISHRRATVRLRHGRCCFGWRCRYLM